MSPVEEYLLIAIGGFFMLIGVIALVWGAREEKKYYESLVNRHDLREFVNHWPRRPEAGALKLGGLITLIVGGALLVMGGVFLLKG